MTNSSATKLCGVGTTWCYHWTVSSSDFCTGLLSWDPKISSNTGDQMNEEYRTQQTRLNKEMCLTFSFYATDASVTE